MVWGTWQRIRGVALASKLPRSQSNWASKGCAGPTNPIHGGSTSQHAGLKGSSAGVFVPWTTDTFRGLVESMLQCTRTVLAARGWPTQY